MTFNPGDLSAIQDAIVHHQPVSRTQFTEFLTANDGVNYRDRDFTTLAELMIGTMPRDQHFDAAVEAYCKAPAKMSVHGDVRFLELARDAVDYLPESRRAKAMDELRFRAPFESAFRDELTGAAPRSNNQPNIGSVVRNLISTLAGEPRPMMA